MLASLHPNSPTTDQAVKDLLDHRARASHTRYTSLSLSQRSDSPSIYSRGDCSPSALYNSRGDWPSQAAYPMSLIGQDRSPFNDTEQDPLSSLISEPFDHDDRSPSTVDDDDDDCISFISAPTPKPALQHVPPSLRDLESDIDSPPAEDVEEDPRMSMLGPKMRFVSRAPWEMEDDVLEEDEEDASGVATDALSIFGGKMSGWRGKDQDKSDKSSAKGLGLSTLRSRSPAPPSVSVKGVGSGMAMNIGLHRHKTPESHNKGPYGSYLSGASRSQSAILNTLTSSSRSLHSMADSQSSDHIAHITSHGSVSPGRNADAFPPLPFPTHPFRPQNLSNLSHDHSAASSVRSDSPPPPSGRYIHPYANPDLIPMAGPPPSTPLPRTPGNGQEQISEDRERQGSPPRRVSESAAPSPRLLTSRQTSAGGLSLPAPLSRAPLVRHDEDDEESSDPFAHIKPVTASKHIPSSPGRSMLSHGDQSGSPMHNLITLEQARARAHNIPNRKGSNGTVSTPKAGPSSTLVAGLGLAPGVVVDDGVVRSLVQRTNPLVPPDPPSIPSVSEPRQSFGQRPRTMSSGKHMFGSGSGADGDVVPHKTLKHKKSAFMKLFGKDKERDKDQPKDLPSPAPELPVRAMSTPPQLLPSESPAPPLPNLYNIKRVPPPLPLSVVVTSPSLLASDSPPRPSQGSSERPASPPRQRQASSPLPSSTSHPSKQPFMQDQWLSSDGYQAQGSDHSRPATSAPSIQTSFEALSLRPVSTIFSAKFPDLLCPSSPPVNPSPTTVFPSKRPSYPSPTTPGFSYSRSNSISTASDYPVTPTLGPIPEPPSLGTTLGEDQSGLIAALQEQIINSRKVWQRQIWELEGQVKDLKAEVEELRNTGECETCGRAKHDRRVQTPAPQNFSVVDRPRPRMGGATRSVFGGGSDM